VAEYHLLLARPRASPSCMRSSSAFVRRHPLDAVFKHAAAFISARCNYIYISRLCYDVSVRLSVRLSVTEVHWLIIANLGFKFRSHFTGHWSPCCCGRRAACGRIISRYARVSCFLYWKPIHCRLDYLIRSE